MMTNLDQILDTAFALYNQGNLEQAENLTREVLSAAPNHGDGLYLLALIAYQKGALNSAIDILFQTLKLYSAVENYRLLLASLLQEQGRLSEALKHYQKCPNNPAGLTQQGFILWGRGKQKESLSLFQQALKLSPNLPEAELGLLLIQEDLKKLRSWTEKTNMSDGWFYLARYYSKNQKWEMALSAIDKTGLNQPAYLIEKGLILEKLGRLDEALSTYQLAAKKNPYRADVWTNQANIFKKNNELNAAEDYYKRALAQDANDIPTRFNLADLLYQMDRIPEALEQYRFILSKNPTDEMALYNLAVILEKTNNLSEALGLYFNILIKNNNIKNIEWRISDCIAALSGQGKEGQKLAKQFIKGWLKLDPNNPIATHLKAALMKQKETDITAYVQKLYDDFAETYQDKMTELGSSVLKEIIDLIPKKSYKKVLDLGCGTGLFGTAFKSHAKGIIGVDISENMLKKASKTNAYQKLYHQDIASFLSENHSKFDLITILETLEYFPNIDDVLSQIKKHLTIDGLLAFSIETSSKSSHLEPNGRYIYNPSYIIEKLKQYGLSIQNQKEINLRKEKTGFATGLLFICRAI